MGFWLIYSTIGVASYQIVNSGLSLNEQSDQLLKIAQELGTALAVQIVYERIYVNVRNSRSRSQQEVVKILNDRA